MSKDKNSKQMSLLEDSHANHSVLQENKKEQMTTDISGQKCLDSLKKSNQSSLLGRMCKALLTSKTAWYSDRCKTNWKVKVSKSNVSLFQLQASVLGTKGIESGLLATPNTMDYLPPRSVQGTKKLMEGHRKGRTKPSNLREQMDPQTMAMYPTPSAQEAGEKIVGTLTSKDGSQLKPNERAYNPKTGKHVQMTLNRTVQMFPTPAASCNMDVVAPPETVKKNSSGWSVTRVGTGKKVRSKVERCSEQAMANTETEGLQRRSISTDLEERQRSSNNTSETSTEEQYTWWQTQSNLCGVPDGISRELDKDRSNRIKSLGNAIVPQCARILGLAIKQVLIEEDRL